MRQLPEADASTWPQRLRGVKCPSDGHYDVYRMEDSVALGGNSGSRRNFGRLGRGILRPMLGLRRGETEGAGDSRSASSDLTCGENIL